MESTADKVARALRNLLRVGLTAYLISILLVTTVMLVVAVIGHNVANVPASIGFVLYSPLYEWLVVPLSAGATLVMVVLLSLDSVFRRDVVEHRPALRGGWIAVFGLNMVVLGDIVYSLLTRPGFVAWSAILFATINLLVVAETIRVRRSTGRAPTRVA